MGEQNLIEVSEMFFVNNLKEGDGQIAKIEELISRTEAELPNAEICKPRYKTYKV